LEVDAEMAVGHRREGEVVAQGGALVGGAEEAATLQLRYDEGSEGLERIDTGLG
jgi:hypothetical protein